MQTESREEEEELGYTGEEQEFGAARAALNGSLHESREAELVALVNVHVTEMPQQEIHGVIVS